MDFISYRGMPLTVIDTRACDRDHVFDDPQNSSTYLYTHWKLSVVCTYNPGATAFLPPPAGAAAGTPPALPNPTSPPVLPAATDVAIRHFLSQPRGQLIVMSAGTQVLRSPPNAAGKWQCDEKNGPFVRVQSVAEVAGERLWKIHLEFETFVNEVPNSDNLVILSNRWSTSQRVNWQQVAERVIQGTCTVRARTLRNPDNADGTPNPNAGILDSFRSTFAAFSVPSGYQRTAVNVTITPDGNTAHYTVTDSQKLFNMTGLASSSFARIEVSDANWVWFGSWGRAVLAAAPSLLPTAGEVAGMASGPTFAGSLYSWVSRAFTGTGQALSAQQPRRYKQCHVRIWGTSNLTRSSCVNLAMGIAAQRLGQTAAFNTTASEIIVRGDTNNMVEVNWTISWDSQTNIAGIPVGAALNSITGPDNNDGDRTWRRAIMMTAEVTGVRGFADPVLTQGVGRNPSFYDSGTRGTDLQKLVVQSLESFNGTPATVP